MIEYRNVHKRFGDNVVLSGVDLTVARGERLSIVGPSGTGKSVLLKTTLALIRPDFGDVCIEGDSVVSAGRVQLECIRRKVGYVFQNAALFDSMTIYENVRMGLPESELEHLHTSEVLDRVCDALQKVKLSPREVLSKLPAELSGGMRKRVGLARAVVGRPKILLFDEPVTGLDPLTAATIHHLIQQTSETLGATSLVVTHDVEGALEYSDRVALLHRGRLRFVGTTQDFRRSEDPLVHAFSDRRTAAEAAHHLHMEEA